MRNTIVVLLVLLLVMVLIATRHYKRESFLDTVKYSIEVNSNQKMAKLYNITNSANIAGVNNNDTYHLKNTCVKWAAHTSCVDSSLNPNNDLTCENSVSSQNGAGHCVCANGDIPVECSENRKDFSCNEVCSKSNPPKALEFNGKDSKVELKFAYEKQTGFTVNFYIRLSNFIRFPYTEQIVLLVVDKNGAKQFMVYINKNRKVCLYSFSNEMNYISDTELDTDWHNITIGSKKTEQFIQVDATRKEFGESNMENMDECLFVFGGYSEKYIGDKANLNNFKGLLGNIKIYKEYLSKKDICKNNKYCGDISSFNNEDKCMFRPEGNSLISCIQSCKKNSYNNGCNIDQCLAKCENCDDEYDCKWKKKTKTCSRVEPDQPVVENPDKCEFKPWGIDKDHCASECSEGENRDKYGGDLCTKTKCADICNKCTDQKFCSWLIANNANSSSSAPNPPLNFIGVPANRMVLLMWSPPRSNNSPIIGYKILYYKANMPKDGVHVKNISENEITVNLKYELDNLENNVVYNIGVIAVNRIGASSLSKLISVKPRDTSSNMILETFVNPTRNSEAEADSILQMKMTRKPNLFDTLRGKSFEIEL